MNLLTTVGCGIPLFCLLILQGGGPAIFFRSEKQVIFSNPQSPDHFTLTAFGADTLDALVLFTIRNGKGNEIYRDSLTSVSFCGTGIDVDYPDDPALAPSARRQFMVDGLKSFLADSNFVRPAVSAGEEIEPICTDSLAWIEFRQDLTVTAFGYHRFQDLRIGIAYSKLRSQVVHFTSEP